MSPLERKVIDLSYKHKLSHIGSNLTAVNIIDKIYSVKKEDEPFVLSVGHAGLALYVVLEAWLFKSAEDLLLKHGIHPNRSPEEGIYCSAGSLGNGICIAVGLAIAKPDRNVYVLMSDGEMAEGSVWEALRIASDLKLENLRITVNCNGYGAYGKVDTEVLDTRMQMFYPSLCVQSNIFNYPDYLQGLSGHYHVISDEEYKKL